MAMSEAGAGTDVLGMATRAEAGAGGATFTLTGSKMWITNGAANDTELGDVFLVYARDAAPVGGRASSYSLFIVEKGMPGFSLGQRIKDKCGMRASNTAELVLDGVRVPAATHLVRALRCALPPRRPLDPCARTHTLTHTLPSPGGPPRRRGAPHDAEPRD